MMHGTQRMQQEARLEKRLRHKLLAELQESEERQTIFFRAATPYSKYDAQGLILMSGRVNPHEVLDFPGQVLDLPDEELPHPH